MTKAESYQFRRRPRSGWIGKDPMQLGGSLVVAPGNADLYLHRAGGFEDIAPIGELVAAVRVRRPAD